MNNQLAVYAKLQQARMMLQAAPLKKSGHNKFAGYQYFELGDFIPTVNKIFAELGLCSMISFTKELATLQIIDFEHGGIIAFTSPMAEANLKGTHPIQKRSQGITNLLAINTLSLATLSQQ